MKTNHRRALRAALYLMLFLGISACSGDDTVTGDSDEGGADVITDVGPDASDERLDDEDVEGIDGVDSGPPGDVDVDPEPDVEDGTSTGFSMQGQLVPTGGMSMSDSMTLSGHLSPMMPKQTSSSDSFELILTPAVSKTNDD